MESVAPSASLTKLHPVVDHPELRARRGNQEISLMLLDQEDRVALWAPQESREHVVTEETKERREALAPVVEMESLVPLVTPDPQDPQGPTDPLA